MSQNRFEEKAWKESPRRRAATVEGARKYAMSLWWCIPGTKHTPTDSRPSVLIKRMLETRRHKAATTKDPAWLWDAKTTSFTEQEMLNIASQLETLESTRTFPH